MAHSWIENYLLIVVVDFQLFHVTAWVVMLFPNYGWSPVS